MLPLGITHGNRPKSCAVPRKEADVVWHGRAIFPAFPDLHSQTPNHRRVVRLKFAPPLAWPSTLIATLIRFHGAGRVEWKR
jgi:hypothetical protein